MQILALNCGSSSLKYRMYQWPGATESAGGEAVRIGPPTAEPARIIHRYKGEEHTHQIEMPDHSTAFDAVSCHLGSGGASLCAVRNGQSVDNTMGFSPLQGLIMSTRSGDLDPAAVLQLLDHYDLDTDRVEDFLNRESGVLGLSGKSSDIRDLLGTTSAQHHNPQREDDAVQTYLWRIRKYLGAYLTVAAPADTIIFTDTVGEEVPEVRSMICSDLGEYGIQLNADLNASPGELPTDIAAKESPVRVLVISTNEELAIASSTAELVDCG